MRRSTIYSALIILALFSCSEIPVMPPEATTTGPKNGRVMLIEEFSGVKCGPCAAGALLLDQIVESADGAIVLYAVHGKFLSEPHSNSKYDFRNPDSREVETNSPIQSKPAITYNRVAENGTTLVSAPRTQWQPVIDEQLERPQVAELDVVLNYDSDTRMVEISAEATALQDLNGIININAVVSESHLIDPQQDGSVVIEDFDHKHVYKESLSKIEGDFLIENLAAGESKAMNYTYTIPPQDNGEWVAENMEITVFISSFDLNGEVLQAAQVKVPAGGEIVPTGRVMLIEEFTGVKCGPCAAGAILLGEIIDASGGAAVAYAIHGKFLSEPHSNSKYDFRNPHAETLEVGTVNLFSKPGIAYNRVSSNGNPLISAPANNWQSVVDTELEKTQVVQLDAIIDYDNSTRTVDVSVDATALENIDGVININAVVSESHLIDPQQDGGSIIDDFDHKHVMKESLSNLDGDFLVENFTAGTTENRKYSYTIPEEVNGEWVPKNMEITIFLTSSDMDGEVLQAIQLHVTD